MQDNSFEEINKKLYLLSETIKELSEKATPLVEFYYIDLEDILNNVRKFQQLPVLDQTILNIQTSNKKLLSKDFNITIYSDTIDTFNTEGELKFYADELIIKKIIFPIDVEEVDLSNKIVISKLSFNTQFYNVKKVKLCRLQIKHKKDNLYSVIPLKVAHLCRHSFFIDEIEGKSYTELNKKEISTLSTFGKLFKL